MISRISSTFKTLEKQNRAALVTFIMAGDPDLATTEKLLPALAAGGADIIELGMPFSDPMADGPTIQAAGLRALEGGTKLKHILEAVKRFRSSNKDTPIVLMGYYNPVYHYGAQRFCQDAAAAGVDGFILVDLPPEEEDEFKPFATNAGIAFIRLVAPTSLEARLPLLLAHAQGFVYYIAVTGITGAGSADISKLKTDVQQLKRHTNQTPIAVGFGVKTPQQAADIAAFSDAVVVGSALVDTIAKAKSGEAVKAAAEFVGALSTAIKSARK